MWYTLPRTGTWYPTSDDHLCLDRRTDICQIHTDGYFRPDEHTSVAHNELMTDYKRRAASRLRFTSAIRRRVDDVFDSIAKKLELKRKEVTYIGIHNRRGTDHVQWTKKTSKKNPLKKQYFYDAMEDMRWEHKNINL